MAASKTTVLVKRASPEAHDSPLHEQEHSPAE